MTIGTTNGLSSEFIYNSNKLDIIEFYGSSLRTLITAETFPHINALLNTCGQSMFSGVDSNKEGIPIDYINPPIIITKHIFGLDVSERLEKYYSIISFHSPLNITLNTTAPLGWILNGKSINDQYINLFMIMNRLPLIICNNNKVFFCNLATFFNKPEIINSFFRYKNHEQITGQFADFDNFIANAIKYSNKYNNEDNQRTYNDNESENVVYKCQYSDGQFTGLVSPQSNDFFQSDNTNVKSDFNNVSFIKCVFQIALLANVFDNYNKFYTLTTGCVIISWEGGNLKFTGKYWLEPLLIATDNDAIQAAAVTTKNLYQRVYNHIQGKASIHDAIAREIGINLQAIEDINNNVVFSTVNNENDFTGLMNKALINQATFAMRLFISTLGLENYTKQEVALTFSGILGHSFDKLLRFFDFNTSKENCEKELNTFIQRFQGFEMVKHIGTPIASYLYDFKNGTQAGLLGNYNSIDFGRVLNTGIIRINDKISNKLTYNPPDIANCLIPIVFNNAILQCKTYCYRSYRNLLNLMKTRKQRDFLFDKLSQYGKRAMTVLDPYGIFMHFHNSERGLVPS